MIDITCPRCQSKFYTAVTATDVKCPFCGFFLKSYEHNRRKEKRTAINKDCVITKGPVSIYAQTSDISRKGAGVDIMGLVPFERDELLDIRILDFEISTQARVVWVDHYNKVRSKVGLKFC